MNCNSAYQKMKTITVYHVPHIKNRLSIYQHGILCMSSIEGRIKYDARIYVSITMEAIGIDYVGYEAVDIWSFEMEESFLHKDQYSQNPSHFFIKVDINPNKICLEATL